MNENPLTRSQTSKVLKHFAKLEGEYVDTCSYVRVLKRRLNYLKDLLATGNTSVAATKYLRAEKSALTWALGELRKNHSPLENEDD